MGPRGAINAMDEAAKSIISAIRVRRESEKLCVGGDLRGVGDAGVAAVA